jgi:uncharacterized protein YceK
LRVTLFAIVILIATLINGCTQIVTAPISLAGKAVTTTVDVVSAVGSGVVDIATGGDD